MNLHTRARRRLETALLPTVAFVAAAIGTPSAPAAATPPPVGPAPQPAPSASAVPGAPAPGGATPATGSGAGSFFSGLRRRDTLFGDAFGIRSALSRHGITLDASETSEELGNVGGGTRRGFVYDGLTQMVLQLDTQRAFGLRGGTFDASALQIHGHNLSATNLQSLQTASGIEADQTSRLWELWYQQELGRDDAVDVKIGQQSLDQEFINNQNASLFVNTMFGWPMLPSADLPGGGPAYPLSALGARLRARPAPGIVVLGGVFNGNPAATSGGDAQRANPSGLGFPLNGGVLAIAEVQYTTPQLGGLVYADRNEPLARTVKAGFWYDSETFSDLAVDTAGVPLVSPLSNGVPRPHQGNYSAYATIDQVLAQGERDPYKTLDGFARVMGTPLGAQNLIAFSFNGGLTLHEPIKRRRDDTLGIGAGFTKVGSGAAAADGFAGRYAGGFVPVRNAEAFVELTYQYQLYPWIQLQPDFQYVVDPGAGLANPNAPSQRIGNEPVFGIRTIIQL